MSSIARNNVYKLRLMGYDVEIDENVFSNDVVITLRLQSDIGFMVTVRYYDLQDDEMVIHIVSKFNDMIMGKLRLEE